MTIGLVACSSQKLQHPAPARDLYISQLFRKASAYAEQTCDRWYILSAKHGIVHPDAVLEPYDVRLGASGPGVPPVSEWAAGVRGQLEAELAGLEDVTLLALAGSQYRTALQGVPWPVEVPMQGMGIGRQLGWLTGRLAA
jgi:hypothetical protein